MKKNTLVMLSLFMLSGLTTANAEEPLPPNEERFNQIRQEIDGYCHSQPPCEESRLYCFLEQVHSKREAALVDEPLFRRLLNEGQMRLAFSRGFQEGLQRGHDQCLPPQPKPKPQPNPTPTGASKPKDGDNQEKVTICHRPPGNPDNSKTLQVGSAAVSAHLAHGDSLGECSANSSKGEQSKDKGKGKENGKSDKKK